MDLETKEKFKVKTIIGIGNFMSSSEGQQYAQLSQGGHLDLDRKDLDFLEKVMVQDSELSQLDIVFCTGGGRNLDDKETRGTRYHVAKIHGCMAPDSLIFNQRNGNCFFIVPMGEEIIRSGGI